MTSEKRKPKKGSEQQRLIAERNRQIVALRADGMLIREIGDRFGLCKETVRQILWKMDRRAREACRE